MSKEVKMKFSSKTDVSLEKGFEAEISNGYDVRVDRDYDSTDRFCFSLKRWRPHEEELFPESFFGKKLNLVFNFPGYILEGEVELTGDANNLYGDLVRQKSDNTEFSFSFTVKE